MSCQPPDCSTVFIRFHQIFSKRGPIKKCIFKLHTRLAYEDEPLIFDYKVPDDQYLHSLDRNVVSLGVGRDEHSIMLSFEFDNVCVKADLNALQKHEWTVIEAVGDEDTLFFLEVESLRLEHTQDLKTLHARQVLGQNIWRLIGHRGFGANSLIRGSLQIRENTKLSIEQAFVQGLEAVEVDVQKLADNVLVLYHDEFVGFPDADIAVNSLKLRQFNNLVVKFPKGIVIEDEPCTFVESLKLVTAGRGINVELKMYKSDCCKLSLLQMHEYCQQVFEDVTEHCPSKNVVFSSFDITLCSLMKRLQASFPVLYVIPEGFMSFGKASKAANLHMLDGLVMSSGQCLSFGAGLLAAKEQYAFVYFTYLQPASRRDIERQFELGVDGLIVDDPRRYRWLHQKPAGKQNGSLLGAG